MKCIFWSWCEEDIGDLGNISDVHIHKCEYVFLQIIEQEMDIQMERFDSLNDYGQDLLQKIDASPGAVDTINHELTSFQDRWDHIVKLMEQQSKQVTSMDNIHPIHSLTVLLDERMISV